jgi:hypothetical protein
MAALCHRVERGEDFFVSEITGSTEKHQSI